MVDPLAPPLTLLMKLGSAVVHAEEMIEPGGHQFDVDALRGVLADPEVKEWLEAMDTLAFLPVRRHG